MNADRGRIEALLRAHLLVDGHNDVPYQLRTRVDNNLSAFDFEDTRDLDPPMHTDLARLRAGCVGAQFWAAYVPCELAGAGAARVMFEQLDVTRHLVQAYPETLRLAFNSDDIDRCRQDGRIASLLAVEGGHGIVESLSVLRAAYAFGARYLTLLHNEHTAWADSCSQDARHGGLTDFGRAVVAEMNSLGMLVDLSHASADTMRDTLAVSRAPVACTHSGAFALNAYPRNVPDDVLLTIRDRGGIVMATFVPGFVSAEVLAHRAAHEAARIDASGRFPDDPERRAEAVAMWRDAHPAPRATLNQVADHVDHLRSVMGAEHVGIGSDFDGITDVPQGLEDVGKIPDLFVELARRGYSDNELVGIAGGNFMRVLRAVEDAAR